MRSINDIPTTLAMHERAAELRDIGVLEWEIAKRLGVTDEYLEDDKAIDGTGPGKYAKRMPEYMANRMRKVAELTAQGRSVKWISEEMGISTATVSNYRRRARESA